LNAGDEMDEGGVSLKVIVLLGDGSKDLDGGKDGQVVGNQRDLGGDGDGQKEGRLGDTHNTRSSKVTKVIKGNNVNRAQKLDIKRSRQDLKTAGGKIDKREKTLKAVVAVILVDQLAEVRGGIGARIVLCNTNGRGTEQAREGLDSQEEAGRGDERLRRKVFGNGLSGKRSDIGVSEGIA